MSDQRIVQAEELHSERSRVARSTELQKWRASSAEVRHKHNIPQQGFAWSSRKGVRLHGLAQTPRVIDVIDTGLAVTLAKNPTLSVSAVVKNRFATVSHSVSRLPVYLGVPTPTTSSVLYSYEQDMVVPSRSVMRLLGWPSTLLPHAISNREYRFLSGNAFSMPVGSLIKLLINYNPHTVWCPAGKA